MNVLLILGHPRKDSLCAALCDAYREGAIQAGARVETLVLADLAFDPNVRVESPEQQRYEPDIIHARELIDRADHLVFVYPTWWGTMPALLKGFLDRVITPDFAFRFIDDSPSDWERLWTGKSAQIITTMDTPPPVYRWLYRQPGNNAMRHATLGFCGVTPVRTLVFGSVKASTPLQYKTWLERARRCGFSLRSGRWTRWERCRRHALTWLRALRLQFYPMSWAAYTTGALAVAGTGAFASGAYWWGYLCLFCLEAATVFGNDYVDYDSDCRNRNAGLYTGGSRTLVDGRAGFPAWRFAIAVALALAAVSAGFVLGTTPQPAAAAALVLAAVVLTLGYTAPPLKLSYRGFGELDVALTHSLLVLLCGYVFLGGAWYDALPWLLGLPLAVAILPAIILAGIPDYSADAFVAKRTLAVRFGPRGAVALALAATVGAAFLALLWTQLALAHGAYAGVIWFVLPHAALLGVLLYRHLQRDRAGAATRIDGLLTAALTYIIWFVAVPFYNLI